MAETLFTRTPRDKLPEKFHLAWDTLNALTGEPAFVEVFASNPEMLEFVMNQFYMGVFFGGKTPGFYWQNGFFWVKLALFALVFALELGPMATFARVRSARKRGAALPPFSVPALRRINSIEIALVVTIVFAAAFSLAMSLSTTELSIHCCPRLYKALLATF